MEFFTEIDSTNRVVKEALERGEGPGFLAVALAQTAGYGRQGRSWSSPPGGLYFSLLLRPQVALVDLPNLSLITALSIRQGLINLQLVGCADDLQVKWPNDVVVRNAAVATGDDAYRKLCGISVEHHAGGVCVGIGINVLRTAAVKTDGRYNPAFVSDMQGARFEELCGSNPQGALKEAGARILAQAVADELLREAALWEAQGFAAFTEKFNACSNLTGRQITVADSMGTVQFAGTVCGVDEQGRLLIQDSEGLVKTVIAGEAHLV